MVLKSLRDIDKHGDGAAKDATLHLESSNEIARVVAEMEEMDEWMDDEGKGAKMANFDPVAVYPELASSSSSSSSSSSWKCRAKTNETNIILSLEGEFHAPVIKAVSCLYNLEPSEAKCRSRMRLIFSSFSSSLSTPLHPLFLFPFVNRARREDRTVGWGQGS